MIADGKNIIEVISINGWSILDTPGLTGVSEGSGVAHTQCDSWIRYGMHPNTLTCDKCNTSIPNEIVAIWLLLNSDKPVSVCYYEGGKYEVR